MKPYLELIEGKADILLLISLKRKLLELIEANLELIEGKADILLLISLKRKLNPLCHIL